MGSIRFNEENTTSGQRTVLSTIQTGFFGYLTYAVLASTPATLPVLLAMSYPALMTLFGTADIVVNGYEWYEERDREHQARERIREEVQKEREEHRRVYEQERQAREERARKEHDEQFLLRQQVNKELEQDRREERREARRNKPKSSSSSHYDNDLDRNNVKKHLPRRTPQRSINARPGFFQRMMSCNTPSILNDYDSSDDEDNVNRSYFHCR